MASPWDFTTPIWYEHVDTEEYPTFDPSAVPVDGRNTCKYLAGGEVRKMVTELAGLDHLEGQLVSIVQDGTVSEDTLQSVVGGEVFLTVPASVVHVGLPYTGKFQMLPLGGDGQTVNETKKRKVFDIVSRIWKSLGGKFGADEDHLYPMDIPDTDDVLFTGDVHYTPFESSWSENWQPVFVQDDPVPFMILALVLRSEISEDK